MSMNNVVNNLVRAAAGISSTISDKDLDAHVAKLLAEEAKARELKWSELGLTGLLGNSLNRDESPDTNIPKTNKRFLASVIRNVDGHNSALLKSQAQSASYARDERRGESSRSGGGGVGNRLFGGALRDMGRNTSKKAKGKERERDHHHSDRRWDDGDDRDKRRSRRYEEDEDYDSRRQRHERSSRFNEDNEDRYTSRDRSKDRYRHRDRSRSRDRNRDMDSNRRKDGKNGREISGRHTESSRRDKLEPEGDISSTRKQKCAVERENQLRGFKQTSPSRNVDGAAIKDSRSKSPSPSLSRSPSPIPSPISKMDKYFSQTYDPRLDFSSVPKEGLIQDVGWDNMLAVLKEKGRKKRHHSPSLSESHDIPLPPEGILLSTSKRRYYEDDEDEYELSKRLEKKERKKSKEQRKKRRGSYDDYDSEEEERERKKEKKRKERKEQKLKEKDDDEKYKHLKKEGGTNLKNGGNGSGSGILDGYEYVKKGGQREWDKGK
ncbi:uncharacterized protein L201_006684 [Kwoniella dendrophila CBS 6074]|uniref:Spp2/MOS2 G-patch domain-containing protein n=1 Tax=Kwoniella dendrophila CBS 6074 TaxID=1295534 RepID=A0AAX4K4G8_9TREE